jgi:hypothetical protein
MATFENNCNFSATTASTFGNPRRQHRGGYPKMGILIDHTGVAILTMHYFLLYQAAPCVVYTKKVTMGYPAQAVQGWLSSMYSATLFLNYTKPPLCCVYTKKVTTGYPAQAVII